MKLAPSHTVTPEFKHTDARQVKTTIREREGELRDSNQITNVNRTGPNMTEDIHPQSRTSAVDFDGPRQLTG